MVFVVFRILSLIFAFMLDAFFDALLFCSRSRRRRRYRRERVVVECRPLAQRGMHRRGIEAPSLGRRYTVPQASSTV